MSSPADLPARIALMEAGLELVADRVGDITGPVVARLYRRCPAARATKSTLACVSITPLGSPVVPVV